MIWLYNLLLTLLFPLWVPWMLLRASKRGEKPNWRERVGNYALRPDRTKVRLWLHAVSVGETVAAAPVLREVRRLAPEVEIILSVTTSSGHRNARENFADLFDHLVYFPIDVPRFTLRALVFVRPKVVAVMETELWMNFLWACKAVEAHTILINGRISDRSFPRSMRLRAFYRSLFSFVDETLMQSEVDRERALALGATSAEVLGNTKFDQAVESSTSSGVDWRAELGIASCAQVIVVGSSRGEMEERFLQAALSDPRLADVAVIHAPRHIERAPAIAESTGGARRSLGEKGRYTILDTYGELAQVYAIADVVVIGGAFDRLGGQNILQPLAHGKPVIHGPNMQNFKDAAELARRAEAALVAATPQELADRLVELLHDAPLRAGMGEAAARLVRENSGAATRYAERIVAALDA